jgi:hypothetical protein
MLGHRRVWWGVKGWGDEGVVLFVSGSVEFARNSLDFYIAGLTRALALALARPLPASLYLLDKSP